GCRGDDALFEELPRLAQAFADFRHAVWIERLRCIIQTFSRLAERVADSRDRGVVDFLFAQGAGDEAGLLFEPGGGVLSLRAAEVVDLRADRINLIACAPGGTFHAAEALLHFRLARQRPAEPNEDDGNARFEKSQTEEHHSSHGEALRRPGQGGCAHRLTILKGLVKTRAVW